MNKDTYISIIKYKSLRKNNNNKQKQRKNETKLFKQAQY